MEIMKLVEDVAKDLNSSSAIKKAPKSISSYASKAIYYFPVLCSKTVTDKNAFMLSENLEASYSSFVQACFAMVPAIKVKGNVVNIEEYLKIFHQNIGINSGSQYYVGLKESCEPYELFPNSTLNEASGLYQNLKDIVKTDPSTGVGGSYEKDAIGGKRFVARHNFSASEAAKHNKLKPSIVKVDCTFLIDGNEVKCSIPVGVKTMLHPVDSDELCNTIMDSVAGKGLLHNIIRYTTGEVLSLTDILFGISKMKDNIKGKGELSKWNNALDHRKRLCRLSKGSLAKKPYLPNIAIIISIDDVNDIEHLIGYNLLKDTHRAVKFMKDNFLLTFVIADDITETAYIMYDGHTSYDEVPYSALKRDNERTADAMSVLSKSIGLR